MLHIVTPFVAVIFACVANKLCLIRYLLVFFGFTMLCIVALFVAVVFACFANILRWFGVHYKHFERTVVYTMKILKIML
jgi:hypothetical protein